MVVAVVAEDNGDRARDVARHPVRVNLPRALVIDKNRMPLGLVTIEDMVLREIETDG